MSDSVRPHGLQPTRLLHPWDFPGKRTGVGGHCLLHNSEWVWINYDSQAETKIAGRNTNNLRYADDTTLMAEGEEKLESFDEGEREEWKAGLRLNIQKTKIMASGPIIHGK